MQKECNISIKKYITAELLYYDGSTVYIIEKLKFQNIIYTLQKNP